MVELLLAASGHTIMSCTPMLCWIEGFHCTLFSSNAKLDTGVHVPVFVWLLSDV